MLARVQYEYALTACLHLRNQPRHFVAIVLPVVQCKMATIAY